MPQLSMNARVRKSPFFDATVRHGVTHFSVYNHMYIATSFGDPEAEYRRLIEGVSLWDVGCERQVELRGPDAEKLAQYLCPRDLGRCQVGQGLYAPVCDHQGRLLNDPILLKLSADRFWLSIADSDLLLWARAIAAERRWDVEVFEPDASPLAIQGPHAVSVVAALFGDWVKRMGYFHFQATELDGIPLLLARSGWSKQGGFELYLLDETRGLELWEKVWRAGEPWNIGAGTPNATERIESGLLSYGTDTDMNSNPFELGLARFVELDIEPDFIGKQALKEIALSGPQRALTGLLLDADKPMPCIEHKCRVYSDDRDIGYIAVNTYSPRLGKNIGIALLQRALVDTQAPVIAALPDGNYRCEQCALPFCR